MLNNQRLPLTIRPNMAIAEVKSSLAAQHGKSVPPAGELLFLKAGTVLSDTKTVRDYNIATGDGIIVHGIGVTDDASAQPAALAAGGGDSGAAVGERWKWRLADGGVRRGWWRRWWQSCECAQDSGTPQVV